MRSFTWAVDKEGFNGQLEWPQIAAEEFGRDPSVKHIYGIRLERRNASKKDTGSSQQANEITGSHNLCVEILNQPTGSEK